MQCFLLFFHFCLLLMTVAMIIGTGLLRGISVINTTDKTEFIFESLAN